MSKEFEMSHMGELNFFFGLQIKQLDNDILLVKKNMLKA